MQTTFTFTVRPLTPTKRIQQQCYMKDLQSQIEHQQQHKAQDQQSRLLKEHLDQVQLVQDAATQRKREELHNCQAQPEKERQMLKCKKIELIVDHINHFERRWDISKTLEDKWRRSAMMRHQQEEEDRRFLRSAGQLLLDQLV